MYGLGIAQPLRYPDSADLLDLQRCNWPNFYMEVCLNRQTFFSKWSQKSALYV